MLAAFTNSLLPSSSDAPLLASGVPLILYIGKGRAAATVAAFSRSGKGRLPAGTSATLPKNSGLVRSGTCIPFTAEFISNDDKDASLKRRLRCVGIGAARRRLLLLLPLLQLTTVDIHFRRCWWRVAMAGLRVGDRRARYPFGLCSCLFIAIIVNYWKLFTLT